MSRSYKKYPFVSSMSPYGGKRFANKKVRRICENDNISRQKAGFKRIYHSWNIRDYIERGPSFEAFYKDQVSRWKQRDIYWWKDKENPPTREACKNVYERWYLRK